MKLNETDYQLIEEAKKVLLDNLDLYEDKNTIVGCVVSSKSGNIYKGINLLTSHSVCAEQVALGQAFACGEREFETIVAVKLDNDNTPKVVSPCGLCRYIMNKLEMDIKVIVEDIDNDRILKVRANTLLPYPYKRDSED